MIFERLWMIFVVHGVLGYLAVIGCLLVLLVCLLSASCMVFQWSHMIFVVHSEGDQLPVIGWSLVLLECILYASYIVLSRS